MSITSLGLNSPSIKGDHLEKPEHHPLVMGCDTLGNQSYDCTTFIWKSQLGMVMDCAFLRAKAFSYSHYLFHYFFPAI